MFCSACHVYNFLLQRSYQSQLEQVATRLTEASSFTTYIHSYTPCATRGRYSVYIYDIFALFKFSKTFFFFNIIIFK